MNKERLDQILVNRGIAFTRNKAQAMIMAGEVEIDGRRDVKAGTRYPEDVAIGMVDKQRWVGRGGEKLAGAIKDFGWDLESKPFSGVWLDCGAATGGFTDVLLYCGAEKVYAIDVGYGQIALGLREDPRVVVIERFNIRYLTKEMISENLDGATLDLSFISLRLVLPVLRPFFAPTAEIIALFKPQFESDPETAKKYRGIIRSEKVREKILQDFKSWCHNNNWRILELVPSRIRGQKGNQEFLLRLAPNSPAPSGAERENE